MRRRRWKRYEAKKELWLDQVRRQGEKKWEGRLKRKEEEEEERETAGGGTLSFKESGSSGNESSENDDSMRRIKGEIYDPTKPKQSEVEAEKR